MSNNQNPEEMKRLQQEAVRRVQEMQSRARAPSAPPHPPEPAVHPQRRPEFFVGGPSKVPPHSPEHQEPHHQKERGEERRPNPSHPPAPPSGNGEMANIFEALMSDSERILILLLILLLVNEEADTGLVLALMYLII